MSLSSAIASYMRPSSIYGPTDIVRWSMFADGSGITRWSPTSVRMWFLPERSSNTMNIICSSPRSVPFMRGEVFISPVKARQLNPWVTNEFPFDSCRQTPDPLEGMFADPRPPNDPPTV